MSQKKMTLIEKYEMEKAHNMERKVPVGDRLEKKTYIAETHEFDARKAEAFSSQVHHDPLLQARALLYRGHLSAAHTMLEIIDLQHVADPIMASEVSLEMCRLFAYQRDWVQSLAYGVQTLSLNPTPITKMTVLQVIAICQYELSRFNESLKAIEQYRTLATIFPKSNTSIYVDATEAKIQFSCMREEAGDSIMENLWKSHKNSINFDKLSTLMRLEIEKCRFFGHSAINWAVGSYLISKEVGEDTYEVLALLDCISFSANRTGCQFQDLLNQKLIVADKRLEDLTKLYLEGFGSDYSSTLFQKSISDQQVPTISTDTEYLYLKDKNLFVSLKGRTVVNLEGKRQYQRLLDLFSIETSVTVEKFYQYVWESDGDYHALNHGPLVNRLLYRARKELLLDIKLSGSEVKLEMPMVFEI